MLWGPEQESWAFGWWASCQGGGTVRVSDPCPGLRTPDVPVTGGNPWGAGPIGLAKRASGIEPNAAAVPTLSMTSALNLLEQSRCYTPCKWAHSKDAVICHCKRPVWGGWSVRLEGLEPPHRGAPWCPPRMKNLEPWLSCSLG